MFSCAMIALLQTRPEVDDPGAAPPRVAAAGLQPPLEGDPRGSRKLRSPPKCYLISRMQREEL